MPTFRRSYKLALFVRIETVCAEADDAGDVRDQPDPRQQAVDACQGPDPHQMTNRPRRLASADAVGQRQQLLSRCHSAAGHAAAAATGTRLQP